MNLDRINEHYHGDLSDPKTQRARQRIHWICHQATGRDVLDIGCSQGIVCLILAREDFQCTGIDLEGASLSVAEAALAREDELVRRRVKFLLADACALPFEAESFDTVVLGEVLEHLTHPERALGEAKRVLREGGRVIVTVPYGLNAYPDHKRTYYPISLLEALQPYFKTGLIDTEGNYILYQGTKDAAYDPTRLAKESLFDDYLRLERAVELRCLDREQALLEQGTRLYAQIKTLTTQGAAHAERNRQLQDALAEKEQQARDTAASTDAALERLRAELAAANAAQAAAEERRADLRKELATSKATLTRLNRRLVRTESRLAAARQELAADQKDRAVREATIAGLKAELAGRDGQLAAAERARVEWQKEVASKDSLLAALNAELTAIRDRLATTEQGRQALLQEASAREADLARLRAERDQATAALAPAEQQRATLEAEASRLRQALRDQDDALQQRLAQVEALETARGLERERQWRLALAQQESDWQRARANQRIRELVRSVLPPDAHVLVISKGEDELLRLEGRCGGHFPQTSGGVYAGYHPADSAEAIRHLETLKAQGAEYLLIPATSFWWLEFYADFRRHLETSGRLLAYDDGSCLIFALTPPASGPAGTVMVALRLTEEGAGNPAPPPPATPPESASKAGASAKTTLPPPAKPAAPAASPAKPPSAAPKDTAAPRGGDSAPPPASPPAPAPPAQTERPPVSVSVTGVSGAPAKPAAKELVVAGVFDEFTAACFGPDCRLVTFRPDNWKSVLDRQGVDLLFVESAWHGNGGSWQYKLASFKKPMGDEIVELVKYCRERRVPTVFWNKEDPPHFDRFIHRAPHFDVVFTSDADMVPRYRAALKHERIFALPFAAQPRIHHPVLDTPRAHNVCFAGAYYAADHEERRADMERLLRPALGFGLHIYDRQHGLAGPQAKLYEFPEIYRPAIRGRLEYAEMVKAYKWYKVFLNVNSVKTSPTMFSRRVFELLASGTPVISAPAKAIPLVLGEDVVAVAQSDADTRTHLDRLLGDEDYWARRSLRGLRAVLAHHTYGHRLAEVCRRAGVPCAEPALPPVTVVAEVKRAGDVERLADVLARQTYRNLTLTLSVTGPEAKRALDSAKPTFAGFHLQVLPAGRSVIQPLVEAAPGSLVWLVNFEDYYGAEFLRDAALASLYSDASVLGKQTYFELGPGESSPRLREPGHDFRRASSLSPGSVVARAGQLSIEQWQALAANLNVVGAELRGVSLDRFNYVRGGGSMHRPDGPGAKARFAAVLA